MQQGPWDEHWRQEGNVSRTLEVAYDWWCVAAFADAIGNPRAAADARRRADGWRKLFDSKTGFMRPRGPSYCGGEWKSPFDPRLARQGQEFESDYTEANGWIYTWHVFQDPQGLAELMGGKPAAVRKLDEFFSTPSVSPEMKGMDYRNGVIGQYWHGNEPSHHIVYFYSQFGAPEKAQRLLRKLVTQCYRNDANGLCGNDDCGQMSAWYLFTMMGFYPVNPCGGEYVIGATQLPKVSLELPNGKTFTIIAKQLSKDNMIVKSVALNGIPITDWKIRHADILAGGELVFEMKN